MHELGIVYQVVKTVDDVMHSQGLTEIDTITLEIGEMSDVVPKFIAEAWQAVKETTSYPNAKMEIEVVLARAKCKSCGHTDLVKNLGFECPKCKATDFEIISGREFEIKQIIAK